MLSVGEYIKNWRPRWFQLKSDGSFRGYGLFLSYLVSTHHRAISDTKADSQHPASPRSTSLMSLVCTVVVDATSAVLTVLYPGSVLTITDDGKGKAKKYGFMIR